MKWKVSFGLLALMVILSKAEAQSCGWTPIPPINTACGTWQMYGGSQKHTGLQRMKANMSSGRFLKWTYNAGDYSYAQPAIGDINNDGLPEVIIAANRKVIALRGTDGTPLWSFTAGSTIEGGIAISDINNDGIPEVVFGSRDYKVYALKGTDGTLLWSYTTAAYISTSPAIGDINNDGIPEVIVEASYYIYALKGTNGTLLWSFYSNSGVFDYSSPAIADVNNDGLPEVIALTQFGSLYVLRGSSGTILWYKIFYPDASITFYSSPVIADVDNDGIPDIVVADGSTTVRALRGTDGNLVWSKQLEIGNNSKYRTLLTPAIGDINNDGIREIIVDARFKIYALRGNNGNTIWSIQFVVPNIDTPVTNWPASIILTDIDPSPGLEIIVPFWLNVVDGFGSKVRIISSSGNLLWDLTPVPVGFPGNLAVGDVDGDGCSEVVAVSSPAGTITVGVVDAPGSSCGFLTPVEIDEKHKYQITSDGIKFDKAVHYELYKIDGRLINKNYGNFVKVKNKGIYLIKVGNETIKFIAK